jgi:host factor-I protein
MNNFRRHHPTTSLDRGEKNVNRKLIRTTLAEVKEREQQARHAPPPQPQAHKGDRGDHSGGSNAAQQRKRVPPEQTNAESFYYKKQMDSRTPMVLVLQDGEVLNGTIEWYDKGSLKLHRHGAPNLLILKHNIKYLYKDEEGGED